MAPFDIGISPDRLQQRGAEGRRGRVFRIAQDRAEPGHDLLRVAVSDDGTQLATVGVRDPQHDPRRIEHRRGARENRGQRKRIHDACEIRAERRDSRQVDRRHSHGCRALLTGCTTTAGGDAGAFASPP